MQFDEDRYVQEFIKKLRGARALPDDLLARYAITLPATDPEIAAQLKAVRAYWNKASSGSSHTAQAAKLCRAEDERLRGKHGAKMETRTWWEAQQAQSRSAAQAAITSLADELRQQLRPARRRDRWHRRRVRRQTQPCPRRCRSRRSSRPA